MLVIPQIQPPIHNTKVILQLFLSFCILYFTLCIVLFTFEKKL